MFLAALILRFAAPRRAAPASDPDARAAHDAARAEEAALLDALRAGDRDAANVLVERTYRVVYRSLVRLTGGDADLAADLTQETYRKAWDALDGFGGRAGFATWLVRIAYTTFLNHRRRAVRRLPLDPAVADALVDPALEADPERRAAAGEAQRRLRRAVLDLPEPMRFAVTAYFWAEQSTPAIAREEGVSGAAIRKRIKTALARLRAHLDETAGDPS
ncbi:MAG: RNA polymerase sigma factor [Acidobacteriota bacterium]